MDQTAATSQMLGTDNKEIHRNRSYSQDTVDKNIDLSTSSSSDEDSGMEECNDDLSERDFDGDARFSAKSLISLSSKASSSTKPVSSKSNSSHQSIYTSSSISLGENGPTADDMKRLREQLHQSLEEEKKLLGIQQKLLTQMEEAEHAIIRSEHEERIARVASQQAYVMNLLDKAGNAKGQVGTATS
jgi:hypothetical protein